LGSFSVDSTKEILTVHRLVMASLASRRHWPACNGSFGLAACAPRTKPFWYSLGPHYPARIL